MCVSCYVQSALDYDTHSSFLIFPYLQYISLESLVSTDIIIPNTYR